jgi:hypothetical protein
MTPDPFEIVSTPLGDLPRWKADALLVGSTQAMLAVHKTASDSIRADAVRTDDLPPLSEQIADLCDRCDGLAARLDAIEGAARCAPSRRFRRTAVCSAGRPSSTM